jgi:hypothetical protein
MPIIATGGTTSYVTVAGVRHKVHTFTTSDTFTVTSKDPADTIEVLMVAGGGGGANARDGGGGGGGAGGLLYSSSFSVAVGSYPLVIGAGGPNQSGGSNTTGFGATANGGGRAGGGPRGGQYAGGNGGSGGGGTGFDTYAAAGSATQGNSNGLTGYGNNGGAPGGGGGSGGGAGAAGVTNGAGGIGRQYDISGTATYYAGGGGCPGFAGGLGGGAAGVSNADGNSGTVNTGGGAGAIYEAGSTTRTGGSGGSGIVIVRYADPAADGFDSVPTSIQSGQTINVTFNHAASSAASSTVSYTITGVTTADIMGNSLTGNFTLSNGSYTLAIPTKVKIQETKTLIISALTYSASVTINPGIFARYLIVAGGGGGGSDMGGGGGAGGYLAGTNFALTQSSYVITVGAGGTGAPAGTSGPAGSNGQNTTALGFTAIGGGGGASVHNPGGFNAGNGGSGGGGSGARQSSSQYGGLPGTGTAGQGNNGAPSGVTWYPGGGGGSGAAAIQTGSLQADGGVGTLNDITGSSLYWAAGGGGAGYSTWGGNGGLGGGGGGAPRQGSGTTNGTGGGSALNSGSVAEIGALNSQTNKRGGAAGVNTGSGGGGGSHYNLTNDGGSGGSGIVVVRYSGTARGTGGTITTVSGDTVHTFTTSGVLTIYQPGLTANVTSTNWGNTVSVRYTGDEADGSTIAYTITGVSSAEINNAPLSGNLTIASGTATLEIQLTQINTLKSSTLTISAGSNTLNIPVTNFTSFTSSATGTFWGGNVRFALSTINFPNNGNVPYTITGVTSQQINNTSLTGNIVVTNSPSTTSNYSVFFDGSGDFLQVGTTNAPMSWLNSAGATGTIEAWVLPTSNRAGSLSYTHPCVIGIGGTYMNFGIANGTPRFYWWTGGINTLDSSITVTLGAWNHLALVFSGSGSNNLRMYVNGQLGATGTFTNIAWASASGGDNIYVGIEAANTATSAFPGYISDLRVVNGTAVYTSTFTPPTAPLSAITGTTILTCTSSTFRDVSTNNYTITKTGDAVIRATNPTPVSHSVFFDGTGDYLSIANGLAVDTSDFTVEAWVYTSAWTVEWNSIISTRASGSTPGATDVWVLGVHNSGYPYIYSGAMQITGSAGQVVLHRWTHLAVSRSGSTMRLFVNGTLVNTTTSSENYTVAAGAIGANRNGSEQWTGYISNLRLVKGTAVYTSTFTPPTAPLTAISGTSLLTCQSYRFIDNSTNNLTITRNADSRIDSFSPHELTYSVFFDGTGDNLLISYNSALHLSGDFTIECWVYPTAAGGMIVNFAGGLNIANASYELVWDGVNVNFAASSTNSSYDIGSETGATGRIGAPTLNQWSHVAVTRSGNVYRGFLNGVQGYTQTLSLTPYDPNARGLAIGSNYSNTWGSGTPSSVVTGYLSNLRILKGTALYTANFTPSTVPLTAIANTSLLTCQSSTIKDNSTNNFTITRNGDARVHDLVPEYSYPNASGPGSGNLTIVTNSLEPVLNQANLNINITVANRTIVIRNGVAIEFGKSNITIQTSTFIDTEVTDVHSQNLEASTATIANIRGVFQVAEIDPTIFGVEFIDTEVSDVHKQNLEAITSSVASTNSSLLPGEFRPAIVSITPTASYAYSSGEDVKISPNAQSNQATAVSTQVWHMT